MASDEIDLFELFDTIWRQKALVIGFTVLAGIVGVGYALFAPKEYEVSSVLRPIAIGELDALNRSGIYSLPSGEALDRVGAQLDSYEARLEFFKAHQDLFKAYLGAGQSLEQSFELFNRNAISLSLPDPKRPDPEAGVVRVTLQYPAGTNGAQILNGFVDYAIDVQRERIRNDLSALFSNRIGELKAKIDAARSDYDTEKESKIAKLLESDKLRRGKLEDELSALRSQMKTERLNRIAELTEAIAIAKTMGIKTPTTPSAMADASRGGLNQVMRTEVSNQSTPLYFLGSEALEAERSVLQQRSNDDFTNIRVAQIGKELQMLAVNREVEVLKSRNNEDIFLQNVEELRAEMTRLRDLDIDAEKLNLVSIDHRAHQPQSPIKPNKKMIVLLSLVAGLGVGVLIALGRGLIRKSRENETRRLKDDEAVQ
ncbi:MAG: ECA polysaccharide chain length modulation protein [Pseudomonas sp.]|nr:MAG: ECA polysaccharide chain length modulation protein [Pseudomonas sp.]